MPETVAAESAWKAYVPFFTSVTLVTGEKRSGPVMRRKTDAGWEYREMTDAEYREWGDYWAW